ncbi:MAG TPA: hypothetical protein PK006_12380 [Saprospiraceae bacterium]|nr:hypothetical protein [Saprospiraceae bacterium]
MENLQIFKLLIEHGIASLVMGLVFFKIVNPLIQSQTTTLQQVMANCNEQRKLYDKKFDELEQKLDTHKNEIISHLKNKS